MASVIIQCWLFILSRNCPDHVNVTHLPGLKHQIITGSWVSAFPLPFCLDAEFPKATNEIVLLFFIEHRSEFIGEVRYYKRFEQ